jgi:hypothetical protein
VVSPGLGDEFAHGKVPGVMASPFPGMDPWLELHWRDEHASLIIYIRDQLQHHERGRYDTTDYQRPLNSSSLAPDDAAWATDLLRKAGRL